VPIHCGALPREVLESELFGHEKGAFTGALGAKPGLIELADGGTLFLDEIGEMEPESQVKLLRVLESRSFFRVGGTRPRRVDLRLVAATNRDLAEAMKVGQFRQDLYYRINTITVPLPPLRDRPEDVALLALHFVEANAAYGPKRLGSAALACLEAYTWPGNVRELEHAIERAVIVARSPSIRLRELPPEVSQSHVAAVSDGFDLHALERATIERALERFHGNRGETAAALKISAVTLWRKMKQYGLSDPTSKQPGPARGVSHRSNRASKR
jgi:transcriptional regulator with PAS, ATPase and Fis domain